MGQSAKKLHSDLLNLRNALMYLHKALLDLQTKSYQRANKHRPSANELYNLALEHPDFAWLRQLSEVIVSIDELLDKEGANDTRQIMDLKKYLGKMLKADKAGNKFSKAYYHAIQHEPSVTLAHARVIGMLRKSQTPK